MVLVACAAALGACGPASRNQQTDQQSFRATTVPTIAPTASPVTPVDTSVVSIDPAVAAIATAAVADLARRLAIDEAGIEVLRAEPVTWPDGSLGCPQPGMMYTQALVKGAQVILAVESRTRVFDYHAGSDAHPFLCESNEPDGGHDFVPPPGFDS
jgi:hypothetical protein